jgi:hypothetical protein
MPLSARTEAIIQAVVKGTLTYSAHSLENAHFDKETAENLADSYKKGFAQNGVFFFDNDADLTIGALKEYYSIKPKGDAPEAPKPKATEFSDEFAARKKKYTEEKAKYDYQTAKQAIRTDIGKYHLTVSKSPQRTFEDAKVKKLVIAACLLQPKKNLQDSESGDKIVIEGWIPVGFYGLVRLPGAMMIDGSQWLEADAMRIIVPKTGAANVVTAYPISYSEEL